MAGLLIFFGVVCLAGLSQTDLKVIWSLACSREPSTSLCKEEFRVAVKLCALAQEGERMCIENLSLRTMLPFFGKDVHVQRNGNDDSPRRASVSIRLGTSSEIQQTEKSITTALAKSLRFKKDLFCIGYVLFRCPPCNTKAPPIIIIFLPEV